MNLLNKILSLFNSPSQIKLPGWYGRSRKKPGIYPEEFEFQLLRDHLNGVSVLARKFCAKFKEAKWGRVPGIFHDTGKATHPFHNRLPPPIGTSSPDKVDHSTWGGKYLYNRVKGSVGKALAFIVCGHHGGLSNALKGQTDSSKYECRTSLEERLNKIVPDVSAKDIKELDNVSVSNLRLPKHKGIRRFLFIKMVHSSIVDADRLDSEKYKNPDKAVLRTNYDSIRVLYKKMKYRIDEYAVLAKKDGATLVDKLRTQVQKECMNAAWSWKNPLTWTKKFFTLTVPTGGAKTLGSMIFALRHALHLKMDRVIYVIPYTSIIEQNAGIFRDILGDSNVIEHHCNFEKMSIGNDDDLKHHYLSVENWDAPVIVTTNVQFFESLYTSSASRNRKIHNIANSVIVLDEAHLIAPRLLKPCIEVLKELVTNYGCSVVFCTATQPGLLKENDLVWGIDKTTEIVKDPAALYKALERVTIEYRPNIKKDSQMATLLLSVPKVLCIVNTRKHALLAFEDIRYKGTAYHLSTFMCATHRKKKIAEIRKRLANDEICRIVSTQLIECGVNISAPCVVRNKCGVESIIQSGGRCNRDGELCPNKGLLIVTNINHPVEDDFMTVSESIASRYLIQQKNLLDYRVAQKAFLELCHNMEHRLDKKGILELIHTSGMEIPFEEVSRLFRMIETDALSIIIPYDDKAQGLISQMKKEMDENEATTGVREPFFSTTRALQPYTVQVFKGKDFDQVKSYLDPTFHPYNVLTSMDRYDDDTGLKVYNLNDLKKYRI